MPKRLVINLAFLFAFVTGTSFGLDDPAAGAAEQFIRSYGLESFKHFHPNIQEAYPFGRSNLARDREVEAYVLKHPVSQDVEITGARYLFDGDWYAVEWLYHATNIETGRKQVESTLAFGRVQDGQLIVWKEYFDDRVGELQAAGELPLYEAGEEPAPWPASSKITHPYRP